MAREPRLRSADGTYHVYHRGNNKKCIFRRDCEYRYFRKLILRYKNRYGFLLYHYVLIKNHIHFSIRTKDKIDISKIMQGIALSYSHYQQKKRGSVGHLWQGRFGSKIIHDDKYLFTSGMYIEKNPVDSYIVKNPSDYPWSSYNHYAFGVTDPLVDLDPLYNALGKTDEERQKAYRDLMFALIKKSVPVDNTRLSK